jgi:hypothetical protein
MSVPKNNKDALAGESESPKPKRNQEKLIRLDESDPSKGRSRRASIVIRCG